MPDAAASIVRARRQRLDDGLGAASSRVLPLASTRFPKLRLLSVGRRGGGDSLASALFSVGRWPSGGDHQAYRLDPGDGVGVAQCGSCRTSRAA